MIKISEFWDFRDDEEPMHRALRAVTACSLGFKPPKPFGVCGYCPARQLCQPITLGILAAAQHKMTLKAAAQQPQGPGGPRR